MTTRFLSSFAFAALMALPAAADDFEALRNNPQIREGLIQFAIARHVHNRCPEISARRLRALSYIEGMVNLAEDLGFSRDEIRSYVNSEAEQDRIRALADARLEPRGASPTMIEGYCTVGHEEIAAGSQIGLLLR